MAQEDTALELVGLIYDAASDANLWGAFLQKLARSSHADSAALVMHNIGQEIHTIAASWEVDPDSSRLYQEHFGSLDIWAMRGRRVLAGHVCASQSLCSLREFAGTQIYNDFMVPFHIEHGMFGLVENNASRWASVSLYRSSSSEEFVECDARILKLLVPHIQRAFKVHFRFSELGARSAGAEAALHMLSMGIIFLDRAGELVFMNRKADELVKAADGLTIAHGKVSAALMKESTSLQQMCKSAVQAGNGKGLGSGGTILISRQQGRPLAVTVAPLRGMSFGLVRQPAAVLFISDPAQKAELPADLLKKGYGLTHAEAALTTLLVEGHSLKDAAYLSGVANSAAKSQLKTIFAKTSVQRQSELIRLLVSTSAFQATKGEIHR